MLTRPSQDRDRRGERPHRQGRVSRRAGCGVVEQTRSVTTNDGLRTRDAPLDYEAGAVRFPLCSKRFRWLPARLGAGEDPSKSSQRSQVQILPPLLIKVQIRGLFPVGEGLCAAGGRK